MFLAPPPPSTRCVASWKFTVSPRSPHVPSPPISLVLQEKPELGHSRFICVASLALDVLKQPTGQREFFAACLASKHVVFGIFKPKQSAFITVDEIDEGELDILVVYADRGLQVYEHARSGRKFAITNDAVDIRHLVCDQMLPASVLQPSCVRFLAYHFKIIPVHEDPVA